MSNVDGVKHKLVNLFTEKKPKAEGENIGQNESNINNESLFDKGFKIIKAEAKNFFAMNNEQTDKKDNFSMSEEDLAELEAFNQALNQEFE